MNLNSVNQLSKTEQNVNQKMKFHGKSLPKKKRVSQLCHRSRERMKGNIIYFGVASCIGSSLQISLQRAYLLQITFLSKFNTLIHLGTNI